MEKIDLVKFRRFSLVFGLILFTYSIAGIELKIPTEIAPLGIPLIIRNPELLGYGLVLGAVYCIFRYWYFAVLIGLSPRKARKRLQMGFLPDGSRIANSMDEFYDIARKEIENYFPIFPKQEQIDFEISGSGVTFNIEKIQIPKSAKFLSLIQDIDYYAPIWLNILAILLFIIK